MKIYKVWAEIEEMDENGEHRDLKDTGEAEPAKIGQFYSLSDAINFAESLEIQNVIQS